MIRAGLAPGANGKNHPTKLDVFRFTSPARHLIEAIAAEHGGEVRSWIHPGSGSKQWEVITETKDIPVYVPKQVPDPWFELWGDKETLLRRCDGATEQQRGRTCLCDPTGVMERDDPNRACKITIRASILLAGDAVGVGSWGIVSHGWNAVDEWTGHKDLVVALPPGRFWPARLVLEHRTSNAIKMVRGEEKMVPRDYYVPMILFDKVTTEAMAAGAEALQALISGESVSGLSSLERREAITVGADPRVTVLLAAIGEATTPEEMTAIRQTAIDRGLGGDPTVTSAWNTRAYEMAAESKDEDEVVADAVVAADVDESADTTEELELAFDRLVLAAGRRDMTTTQVRRAISLICGVAVDEATVAQLDHCMKVISDGGVVVDGNDLRIS
jgi:hypothetical protein